ncbi:MAG: rod shape-determining protein RodA, partial [Candidatus Rokuibacteriota bacterium]
MLRVDRRLLQNVDWALLATALFIVALSVLSMWNLAPRRGGTALAWRQLSWVGIGLVALLVVASVDYRSLVRIAPAFYVVGVSLLVVVFVLGRTVSGARRWIHLGPITFQPSELFKLIFVLTLTWALASRPGEPLVRGTVMGTLALLGVPFLLVVRQPDLGTALVLIPVVAAVLVGVGVRLRVLGAFALAGLAALPLGWFALKPYQQDRLLVYLDPFRDPLGTAY